ncbi:putative dolichyl pyrophosphate Man9GlcNAc2 alpha-1,3-glucosyltransferase [Porphyridium purpureum]|uniref:Alpha-1,3-glucosyltransferase n=1 Tax=Porphyridium purpureum TaxID=35688 RepID=A0A5J4YQU5_PORPP|nr:putative dolichyl pyrophosphate Man9GlcNAc2 alpha-1,3-glucosyltransferase [Porphyridium purpureum]|eukprot:POR0060..scf296_7
MEDETSARTDTEAEQARAVTRVALDGSASAMPVGPRRGALAVITLAAVLWHSLVAMYPYSGEGLPPMYGDFEAQRHWMELTVNLPPRMWYVESELNDLKYWGLDYPPLSAYMARLFASFAPPESVALVTSRGFESEVFRAWMRNSVIVADLLVWFPAVALFASTYATRRTAAERDETALFAVLVAMPCLVLIDHAHFQYNAVGLGLFVLSVALLLRDSLVPDALGCFAFCLALNFKQMNLYYALAVAFYLLGKASQRLRASGLAHAFTYLLILAGAVFVTFASVWWPWLGTWDDVRAVLLRVFPLHRGVYEDKVANAWCSLGLFYRPLRRVTPWACLCATLLASAPFCLSVLTKPDRRTFVLACAGVSLSFFLFSYQVHEKHVLLPLTAVTMLCSDAPWLSVWMNAVAMLSVFPLLDREGSSLAYVGSQLLNVCVHLFFFRGIDDSMPPSKSTSSSSSSSAAAAAGHRWRAVAVTCHIVACHAAYEFVRRLPCLIKRWPDLPTYVVTVSSFLHLCAMYVVLLRLLPRLPHAQRRYSSSAGTAEYSITEPQPLKLG